MAHRDLGQPGQFDPSAITGETWRRFAGENRLDAEPVLDRVRRYADVIPGAMKDALAQADDWDGTAGALAERLLPATESHLATVTRRAR